MLRFHQVGPWSRSLILRKRWSPSFSGLSNRPRLEFAYWRGGDFPFEALSGYVRDLFVDAYGTQDYLVALIHTCALLVEHPFRRNTIRGETALRLIQIKGLQQLQADVHLAKMELQIESQGRSQSDE